ncbi:hypothetical protein [Desulfonema magnum]|uniref:Uncharacterized protein n=1 Tax=Desulfonema magnum TaxID=45655 RepID=A0A975BW01_9BACT|nr:hypothetical protein [Desulfonema magnum]QTA92522.1 Uncharacterized protein dnm_086050 [Desulfonema magnum]
MAVSNRSPRPAKYPDDRGDYQLAFRKHVFQLLKWGYDRLDALQYQDWEEEEITSDLARELDEIVQDRSYPRWVGRYSVHEEKPITTSDRKGKKRQRLDIEIERLRHGRRPRYSFEAKRLCANTHATMGAYLGPEGLGEFLSGNYAAEENEAGMLGYVQSDTPEAWSEKAQDKFRSDPDLVQAYAGGTWSDTSILSDSDYCYCSCHQRITVGRPITLYHLFLVFC